MSGWMLIAQRAGWLNEQPPEAITRRLAQRTTGQRPTGTQLDVLSAAAHLSVGSSAGAIFGLVVPPQPNPLRAATAGAGYGLMVWCAGYVGFLPALDLMSPPPSGERRRTRTMVVAHIVYGAALGLIDRVLANHLLRQDSQEARN